MAESYYEKMKRIRKEQKQRRTLTGGLGDAGAVRKKESTTKKATRPYRKRGSGEALPNLKKLREIAKKMKLMGRTAMGSRTPAGTTQPRKPKAPTTLNITDTALGSRTPKRSMTKAQAKKYTGSYSKPDASIMSKVEKKPTSFGAAFKAARKRLGAGKTFTYKGKKYSTNTKADLAKRKPKARPVTKKKIDPFAIKGTAKKKVSKSKGKFTEPVDRKKKSTKKNVMSTKDTKYYKGTNITPTKLQRDRMRKRKLAST